MAKIKTHEMYLEHSIKIKHRSFYVLLITSETWLHLNGPSEIQRK